MTTVTVSITTTSPTFLSDLAKLLDNHPATSVVSARKVETAKVEVAPKEEKPKEMKVEKEKMPHFLGKKNVTDVETPTVTYDQIKNITMALVQSDASVGEGGKTVGHNKAVKLLARFGAKSGTDLKVEQYNEYVAAVNALLATPKEESLA